jgi:hypothetical protein
VCWAGYYDISTIKLEKAMKASTEAVWETGRTEIPALPSGDFTDDHTADSLWQDKILQDLQAAGGCLCVCVTDHAGLAVWSVCNICLLYCICYF